MINQSYPQRASADLAQPAKARSAGPRDSASEASLNLEYSTHLSDSPCYSITLMDFGDVVECRAVYCAEPLVRNRRTTSERVERLSSCYEDPEKLAWRIRRAQRLCRWRTMGLRCEAMWTLTKRDKFESVDDAYDALTAWRKKIHAWSGREFKYVAVPEQHADGRWHIHVAVGGYWDVRVLRMMWYRALGGRGDETGAETPGGVNIKPFKGQKCSAKVARYISKYMAKSFTVVGNGKKSYWASPGLGPVQTIRWREPVVINRSPLLEVKKKVEAFRRDHYESIEWDFAGTTGFIIKTRGS